jgi:hypothetical protein
MEGWQAQAIVVAATAAAIASAVLIHFEGLVVLGRHLGRHSARVRLSGASGRWGMLWVIAGLLALHCLEIALFGATYWGLGWLLGLGDAQDGLLGAIYLSATTYSTVGYGDVSPLVPLRFLMATESVVGLLLIAWSGSFTFLEMSRHWRNEI